MNQHLVKVSSRLVLLTAIVLSSAATQAQIAIPPSAKVTPDTTKPGFNWTIFANQANQANDDVRPENALAGLLKDADGNPLPNLADPAAQGVAIAPSTVPSPDNAPVKFEIATVINVSHTADTALGFFTPDEQMPGVPATDGSNNGLAVEILTYLDLPAGVTTMGVSSDDGFVTSSGNVADAFSRVVLGSYVGGRGVGDTIFTFSVAEAGVYPFRTVYEQGGGDANIEWWTSNSTTRVLLNDTANGGVKAYRAKLGTIDPYVKSVTPSPVPRQLEKVSSSLVIALSDGNPRTLDDNSIVLQYDGATVTPTKGRQGSILTLTYTPSGLQLAGDQHTAILTFKDSTGTFSRTNQWTFYNMENLILPASPVTGENFDSYPEATSKATTVPPGWVATNFTFVENPAWDLTDIKSDAFLDWVLISTDTVLPLEDEVLDNDKTQLINGKPVTNWMSGNLIFVASDGRASKTPEGALAPQVQFVVSKPFNLSTVTNPVLTFSSGARLSIGNPDQMTMEYSIDGGTNWLPVIYMRSSSTIIVNSDGSYDALAMFNTVNTNVVVQWPTPGVGPQGGKWGDALAAPISQALAPYIANRNDGIAARRVEAIRLPQASKQSDVRLRLTHISHCGWEWGVDNIAFYDIPSGGTAPPPLGGPTITITRSGTSLTLSWPASDTGFTLESKDSLSSPTWTAVPGVVNNSVTVQIGAGSKFYRLRK